MPQDNGCPLSTYTTNFLIQDIKKTSLGPNSFDVNSSTNFDQVAFNDAASMHLYGHFHLQSKNVQDFDSASGYGHFEVSSDKIVSMKKRHIAQDCIKQINKKQKIMDNKEVEDYLRFEFNRDFSRVIKNPKKLQLQGVFGLPDISPQTSAVLSLLEDLALLHYHMSRATTRTEMSVAMLTYCKLRFKSNLYEMLKKVENACESIIWDSYLSTAREARACGEAWFRPQSIDDFFKMSRDYINNFEELKKSPIFPKLYKFSMYILSLSLFDTIGVTMDNVGYTKMEQEAMKKKYCNGIDFYHTMADTLLFICERGYQIIVTKSIDPIYHSPKKYEEWFERANLLKRQSLLLNDPAAHGFTEHGFLADLSEIIESGESIYKHATRVGEYERSAVRHFVNELHMIRCNQLNKRSARASRLPPFSILVSGSSGIGKSTIKDLLFHHYAKVQNLPSGSEFCYTRNPAANFWDGFATSQWCVILDDVAYLNVNAAPGGDPSCMEFLQIVNAVPFVPDQASLEDKGRTPMRPKLCIATTNTEHLNAYYYFSCPSAAQRRFPYILCPKPKPEFRGQGGMLDSTKIEPSSGYPDYWLWTVKKVELPPVDSKEKRPSINIVHENLELKDFLIWYNSAILAHDANQNKVQHSIKQLASVSVCKSCYLPESMCTCLQSIDIVNHLVYSSWFAAFMSFCAYWAKVFLKFYYKYRIYKYFKHSQDVILEQKEFWSSLGKKAQSHIGQPALLAAFAVVLASTATIYKFSQSVFAPQGANQSRPVADEEERENVWYKDDYALTQLDLTPTIVSMKGLTPMDFWSKLMPNCYSMISKRSDDNMEIQRPGKAVCLSGQVFIACNHTVPDFEDYLDIELVSQSRKDGLTKNITFKLVPSQLKRYPEKDLVVFYVTNLPPGKSIVELFAKNSFAAKCNGFYAIRERTGEAIMNNVNCLRLSPNFHIPELGISIPVWFGTAQTRETVNGDCGSPLVTTSTMGNCIVGLHSLGAGNRSGATQVTQEFVLEALESFKNFSVQSTYTKLNAPSTDRVLGDLNKKSIFRYIEQGTASVIGSYAGFRQGGRTRVTPSLMRDYFVKHGYPVKYSAPVVKGWAPWRIAALDMVKPVVDLDEGILDLCARSYIQDIVALLPREEFKKFEIYDDFTAINGAPGVSYVDKINRNTSSGNPWNKSKKFFMTSIPPIHGLQDPVVVDDEIMQSCHDMEDRYKKGERVMPIYRAHLKDEPTSFAKVKAKKTRVFTGAPFDFTIVVRKYLLSFIRVAQNNRLAFEAAPGTITQSTEWGSFYDYLTKFGKDQLIAGDYKAFDKRMPPCVILKAFDIIATLCEMGGNYDAEDIRVIRSIAYDVAFPLVDYNGDLVQFFGSNPSGHPLTVTINSLVNSLYVRYCYYVTNPAKEVASFKSNVSLITYGDDNSMGVSKSIPWFNHTSIANVLAEVGITYTMADKEAESVPYITIDETSFVKRTWRYDHDVGAFLCPLAHDSIEKMLTTWVASKTISPEEQAISVLSSAAREYFQYGKEVFHQKRNLIMNCVKELKLELWVNESTFPSWEAIEKDFWKVSKNLSL